MRLAGPASLAILSRHFRPTQVKSPASPWLLRHGLFTDREGASIDEVTAVYMPEGQSYTGLEQVEIFCHGGHLVVRQILHELLTAGARAAEPGEFTRLAFLSGRIDLARAEAVAEVIAANTEVSLATARNHLLGAYTERLEQMRQEIVAVMAEVEASIDFPEEEIEPAMAAGQRESIDQVRGKILQLAATYRGGRIIREGYRVTIGGRPNAGKSSLFNRLLRQERAIVAATPGTTRDYLSEWIDLHGYAVNLVDTAGIRRGGGAVEQAGQTSARKIMEEADLVVWLVDLSAKDWQKQLGEDLASIGGLPVVIGANKIDLVGAAPAISETPAEIETIYLSCKTGEGIDNLVGHLVAHINEGMPDFTSGMIVTSARHRQKLETAETALRSASEKISLKESPELVAFDLRQAAGALEEITGRIYNEDILDQIFSKFCIGK